MFIDRWNAWRWTMFAVIDSWLERMEYDRALRRQEELRVRGQWAAYAGAVAAAFRRWG